MSDTAAFDPAGEDFAEVRAIIEGHRSMPGAMLPLLHAVQGCLGWVPGRLVPEIAEALGRSRAEVQGVLDFYHDFRRARNDPEGPEWPPDPAATAYSGTRQRYWYERR
jgi:formate dehydrogenase subunit gamma